MLIQLAFIDDEKVLNLLADKGNLELFPDEDLQQIWHPLHDDLKAGHIPETHLVLTALGEGNLATRTVSRLLASSDHLTSPLQQARDCLALLQAEHLKREIEHRRAALQEAQQEGKNVALAAQEVTRLQKELAALRSQSQKAEK